MQSPSKAKREYESCPKHEHDLEYLDVTTQQMKCLVCVDTENLNSKLLHRAYKECPKIMAEWQELHELAESFFTEVQGKPEHSKFETALAPLREEIR